MNLSNFQLIKELGRGTFGVTFLANDLRQGFQVAVKVIDVDKSAQFGVKPEMIAEEIDTLRELSETVCSTHMSCYYGSFQGPFRGVNNDQPPINAVFIVSQFIDGGSLESYIRDNGGRIPPQDLWNVYEQLIDGLEFIHSHGYAHRDIKPANVMITRDGVIKYIDFGFACLGRCRLNTASCTNLCASGPGTLLYQPPEFFNGTRENSLEASQAHDVWSTALVMWELAMGTFAFPFPVVSPANPSQILRDQEMMASIAQAPSLIPDYRLDGGQTNSFLLAIAVGDWRERPTISQVKQLFVSHGLLLHPQPGAIPIPLNEPTTYQTFNPQAPAFAPYPPVQQFGGVDDRLNPRAPSFNPGKFGAFAPEPVLPAVPVPAFTPAFPSRNQYNLPLVQEARYDTYDVNPGFNNFNSPLIPGGQYDPYRY